MKKCPKQLAPECQHRDGLWHLEDFAPDKNRPSGRTSWCRACRRIQRQQWGEKNKDHLKKQHQEWVQMNPERNVFLRRRHYVENRQKSLEATRAWRLAHPARRLAQQRMRNQRIKSLGTLTDQEWQEVLEKYGRKCLRCGSVNKITIDHIIPTIKGGPNTKENVQPLCHSCNCRKSRKIIDYRPDHQGKIEP